MKLNILEIRTIIKHIEKSFLNVNKRLEFDINNLFFFPSKKNYVLKTYIKNSEKNLKIPKDTWVIIKYFNPKIDDSIKKFSKEIKNHEILTKLFETSKIVKIPKIYASVPGIILYENIDGKNLFELLFEHNLEDSAIDSLADFLFYLKMKGYIFGDARLRNFVYSTQGDLVPVDYEEMSISIQNEDLFQISCSFIDYTPGIFEKTIDIYSNQKMIHFLRTYHNNLNENSNIYEKISFIQFSDDLLEKLFEMLKKIAFRRKLSFGLTDWEDIHMILRRILD